LKAKSLLFQRLQQQNELASQHKIEIDVNANYMNMAWDRFKPCPALKELIPQVMEHQDTLDYNEKLKREIYPQVAELLEKSSDQKYTVDELDTRKIVQIYDSYNSDKFHGLEHLDFTDEQVLKL